MHNGSAHARRARAPAGVTTGRVSRSRATAQHRTLAAEARILDRFAADVRKVGLAGEERAAKLVYLVLTSRLLERPLSAVLKAPSAAGKSYLVDTVLRFFPPSAFYTVSGMSERALVYSEEPLAHRIIVIYEAAGMAGDGFAPYFLRTLLSEGHLRYETVETPPEGQAEGRRPGARRADRRDPDHHQGEA